MNDTHPTIKLEWNKRMRKLSGSTRMIMGSRMFDASREIAIASFPKSMNSAEIKRALFLRFYGDDFDEKTCREIIESL